MKAGICALLVVCILLAGCSGVPKTLNAEEIYNLLSVSTVEIVAESDFVSSLGSGFFIDDKGTIVTNYHVIEDCSEAYITANDSKTYEVKYVLGYDLNLDVAILATSCDKSTPVKMSDASITTGETIYVLGSSLGLTGTFSEGLVSSSNRNVGEVKYIQISAPISHGNSGGPVANTEGLVVGIASAGFEEGQNLNLALPISVLQQVDRNKAITMTEFYEATSQYAHLGVRVVAHGSTLAVRTITFSDQFTAEFVLALWKNGEATEHTMIEIMDEYGMEQGGGQLYIIDPGVFVEEIDAWCFSHDRRPGDYAIIKNRYGYSICYISMMN